MLKKQNRDAARPALLRKVAGLPDEPLLTLRRNVALHAVAWPGPKATAAALESIF